MFPKQTEFADITNVLVLPSLLPVPDGDVEALLGQVADRARVDKLLVEIGVQRLPLDRRHVLRVLRHRMKDATSIIACLTSRLIIYIYFCLHLYEWICESHCVHLRQVDALDDCHLEGARLGVEGERDLHLADVRRHDKAVVSVLRMRT